MRHKKLEWQVLENNYTPKTSGNGILQNRQQNIEKIGIWIYNKMKDDNPIFSSYK